MNLGVLNGVFFLTLSSEPCDDSKVEVRLMLLSSTQLYRSGSKCLCTHIVCRRLGCFPFLSCLITEFARAQKPMAMGAFFRVKVAKRKKYGRPAVAAGMSRDATLTRRVYAITAVTDWYARVEFGSLEVRFSTLGFLLLISLARGAVDGGAELLQAE